MLEDMLITRVVRGVLARNWVSTKRLDYSVVGRVVYLRGMFEVGAENKALKGRAGKEDPISRIIQKVEDEIRAYREVKDVQMKLTGWEKSPRGWTRIAITTKSR